MVYRYTNKNGYIAADNENGYEKSMEAIRKLRNLEDIEEELDVELEELCSQLCDEYDFVEYGEKSIMLDGRVISGIYEREELLDLIKYLIKVYATLIKKGK